MMKIPLDEIKKVFDDLIQEKVPREEIVSWASKRYSADKEHNL